MSILVNERTKVICQGITGKNGTFHTEQVGPSPLLQKTLHMRALAARGLRAVCGTAAAARRLAASLRRCLREPAPPQPPMRAGHCLWHPDGWR